MAASILFFFFCFSKFTPPWKWFGELDFLRSGGLILAFCQTSGHSAAKTNWKPILFSLENTPSPLLPPLHLPSHTKEQNIETYRKFTFNAIVYVAALAIHSGKHPAMQPAIQPPHGWMLLMDMIDLLQPMVNAMWPFKINCNFLLLLLLFLLFFYVYVINCFICLLLFFYFFLFSFVQCCLFVLLLTEYGHAANKSSNTKDTTKTTTKKSSSTATTTTVAPASTKANEKLSYPKKVNTLKKRPTKSTSLKKVADITDKFKDLPADDLAFIKELDKQFKQHGGKVKIKVENDNSTAPGSSGKNSKRTIEGELG